MFGNYLVRENQYSGLKYLTLIHTQTADKLGALVACLFPTVTSITIDLRSAGFGIIFKWCHRYTCVTWFIDVLSFKELQFISWIVFLDAITQLENGMTWVYYFSQFKYVFSQIIRCKIYMHYLLEIRSLFVVADMNASFWGLFRTNFWDLNFLRTKFFRTNFLELTNSLKI